ncbi:MAG TPA: helix-turn-helix domain-containing protein [Candidatus Baltobacteraceae bacterium]|nr:helix-turn-helix domain-containing protein [Candidatus Baltobacteraceae bacterium]
MKIGPALTEAAETAGLSDVQIAAAIGTNQVTVVRWMRGESEPRGTSLLRLFEIGPGFEDLLRAEVA